ncbi:MAG: hypothetical protein PHY54_10310 [Methylococcales bacterium]|nr:hypothetical protein [Methylococcales bacterium]
MALTQLAKKYIVQLTKDERLYLESLIYKGKVAAHKRLHAEILLKADISELGAKWLDNRCGLAMLHKLAGGNPVQVIASHEPGIEPCRHIGNDVLDA